MDAGLRAEWNNDLFLLEVLALTDLLGEHGGQEFSATVSKEYLDGFITPRLGFKYQSDDIIDHYYGVPANEVKPSRALYIPGGGSSYIAGATLAYPINDEWALIGDFEFESLPSEIRDSPIVDLDEIFTAVIGVVYRY